MTPKESKLLGLKYSLLSALYIFIVYELILLVSETRSDFANGILFFIDSQMNLYTATVYVTLFLSFSLLGISAGYRIVIKKAAPIKVGIFYALITTVLVFIMPVVQLVEIWNLEGIYDPVERGLTISFFQVLLIAFLCFLGGWLLAVYRINKRKTT